MKYIYRFSLLLSLLHCPDFSIAQTALYQFSKTTATYNNLQTPTVLTTTMAANYEVMNIPAGFKAFGVLLPATLKVGKNGWSDCTGTTYSFAFNPYLAGLKATPATSVGYKLDIIGQDSILKIQWRNVSYDGAPAGDSMNFQCWLFKKSQAIEFHYGPSRVTASPVPYGAVQIALLSADFTLSYEIHSLNGDVTSVKDSLSGDTLIVHNGFPANGTVFRYTAPSLSVKDIQADNCLLYPNPATDMIYTSIAGEARYYIVNAMGTLVASGTCSATHPINTSKLAAGIYTARMVLGDRQHTEMIEIRK